MNIIEWKNDVRRECCVVVRTGPSAINAHKYCSRYTAFVIDGAYYCRQHAGEHCLQQALECQENKNA